MGLIKELVYRLRGEVTTEKLIKRGMKVGDNFSRQNNVILDPGQCWLIEIGDNVTLAPRVIILCHDASPQRFIKCSKVGKVVIGNNVFVGANTAILPGVKIGIKPPEANAPTDANTATIVVRLSLSFLSLVKAGSKSQ